MTLAALVFDYFFYLDLPSRDASTQLAYIMTILLTAANILYIYLYKLKHTHIPACNIAAPDELLKVKWLAHLLLAFFVPIAVFIFNRTPEYRIMRFNKDFLTIVIGAVGVGMHYWMSNFAKVSTIDVVTKGIKKEVYAIMTLGLLLCILIGSEGDAWIIA